MSEEKKDEPVEVSAGEEQARKGGWCPEEDWKGDKAEWVDYSTFNRNGEFMRRINEQSSIIKHLTNKVDTKDLVIDDMAKLANTISEREYKRALETLLTDKAAALEEDNHRKVVEVDEEISELKEHKPEKVAVTKEEQNTGDVPAEIIEWLSKPAQSWYHTNAGMRSMADTIAQELQNANPGLTPSQMLTQVDAQMRKDMPNMFTAPVDSGVDTGGEYQTNSQGRRGSSKKPRFSDLTEMEQDTCKRFEKQGVMSRDEYMEQLFGLEG